MQQQKKEEFVRIVKYVLFSISAGVIQSLAFTALHEIFHWTYWPCYLSALVLSVLWNFTLNRKFTFQSAANIPRAMLLVLGYYCVFTPASTLWGNALANAGWNYYLILFGTMLINLTTEFLFWRLVVYKNSINTNEQAKKRLAEQEASAAQLEEKQ
ncbi:MAG TPA: GtrA family protein [Clostridia bacterium]|nr:GtrA family protein [Clostridia bacterium]